MEAPVNVNETFTHKPLDLNKTQLRLFRLTKARPGKGLNGEISIFDFEDCPEYRAVSYTWGPPFPALDILLNGRNFSIRENLWHLIASIQESPPIWLWIDQICIDQSAVEERNHQVRLMATIYAKATQVVIWLGAEADGSSDAMKAINAHLPTKQRHGTEFYDYEHEAEIEQLFRRPYWDRLWVLQEIFMARDILVFCGEDIFSWSTLEAIFTPKVLLDDFYEWDCPIQISEAVLSLVKEKAVFEHPNHRLAYILETFSGCECEDIRDKVFGLLSLVRESGRIPVDYSKTPSEVYFATVDGMILDEQSTDIEEPFRVAQLLRDRMMLTEVSDVEIFDYVEQRLCSLGRDSNQKHLEIENVEDRVHQNFV